MKRFNLPSNLKNDSVLVKEDQDRLVIELAQIFNNDKIAIVKDPRAVHKAYDNLVKRQEDIGLKRKAENPVGFYAALFAWD